MSVYQPAVKVNFFKQPGPLIYLLDTFTLLNNKVI
ncbi:hypothetical protein C8P68_102660 [Mucilaginibacter yixingensis]|uniref:Uncharacterized protein n=1 Tax=Mucilaginibacter yixingensis TaxID=1295612 RepID=A0A2T5JDI1_9SPHI|nr:hypothetical protein C8P68_102660 [Mucilaginibacter yixingensis]